MTAQSSDETVFGQNLSNSRIGWSIFGSSASVSIEKRKAFLFKGAPSFSDSN
jgi:hypothetical protein